MPLRPTFVGITSWMSQRPLMADGKPKYKYPVAIGHPDQACITA
jgi:hypothetical protein